MDAYELMERTDTTPTVKAAPPVSCPRCGTQRVTIHSLNGRYWIACHHGTCGRWTEIQPPEMTDDRQR